MTTRCDPGAGGRKIIPARPRRACALAALLVALAAPATGAAGAEAGRISAGELLSGPADGFARAARPRAFSFPADHGPHGDYRVEWWYFTGNLATARGRPFGFQLTFFRFGLARPRPGKAPGTAGAAAPSAWRATDAWMAHFALTDPEHGRLRAHERFARGAVGLAGARATPFRVWLHDWHVEGSPEGTFPLRLRAREHGVAIDLVLDTDRAAVLQGDDGLSRKSEVPGNASYYYSYTRLDARGTIAVAGLEHVVSGSAWWDREWSTSALDEDQVGWDWFALQLSDGRDLMFYRLRRRDGGVHPSSAGSIAGADGTLLRLAAGDVSVEPIAHFESPRSRVRYPVRWLLRVPGAHLDLVVEPLIPDQEVELSVRYWEGAVRVRGTSRGQAIEGVGYLELAGYEAAGTPPAARR